MRLAGTCSRYSNRAIPQLAKAATIHGRPLRLRRWAYQAKVMNTFERTSRPTVRRMTFMQRGTWDVGRGTSNRGERFGGSGLPAHRRCQAPHRADDEKHRARRTNRACDAVIVLELAGGRQQVEPVVLSTTDQWQVLRPRVGRVGGD